VLGKCPTGIAGFDQFTLGGIPRDRTTLLCGAAGCGKTLFGIQFLVRGALDYGEPGVFLSFEETAEDLGKNVASLGIDLADLERRGLLSLDHLRFERSEIQESGEYDLEGLFLRLDHAIESIGAKRVVIDTLETLFGALSNEAILRAELVRLFRWLKDRRITAVITAERGDGGLTRHGIEEYVSDCVVFLDHRVVDQISTRRVRVVKYRGSAHGSNEYPFLIDESGIHVVPITEAGLSHAASDERISTGIPRLDHMLGGKGFYRGSTVLVSGTAGTGKSSLAAHFADAACGRRERCFYFSFEESPAEFMRNMRSIGIDLERHSTKGLLSFSSSRPTAHGLEMHLALMHRAISDFRPSVVVVDPISNLIKAGTQADAHLMLVRLVDFLKSHNITTMLTALTGKGSYMEDTNTAISSVVDSWLVVRDLESQGERNRGLYVVKSRGTSHSNQIREFLLTARGIDLLDVYTGPEGVLMGTARLAREARDSTEAMARDREVQRRKLDLERRRASMEEQVSALRADFKTHELEVEELLAQAEHVEKQRQVDRISMARLRRADAQAGGNSGQDAKRRKYGKREEVRSPVAGE
jgi:circadian clock protein KaiC